MMKILGVTLGFLLGVIGSLPLLLSGQKANPPKADFVEPKITHTDEVQTQHYDRVTITCPEGYEGHFVDPEAGFEANFGNNLLSYSAPGYDQPSAYTICFSKEFMDKIRSKPELFRPRPAPPRAV